MNLSEDIKPFLEETIKFIAETGADKIAFVAICKDLGTVSCYHHCEYQDKAVLVGAIQEDMMTDFIENNSELIRDILSGDE